jgi:DNA adenine methylase
MPTVSRKVKGAEYLYFREWDPAKNTHHDEYLGRKGNEEAEQKSLLKEREYTLKQINQLQTKLTEIDSSLAEFAEGEKALKAQKEPCHPFVKWAGGKTQLVEKMSKYFPEKFNRYFEPFLGGGAVFFYLAYRRPAFPAILSDINHDLINAYEVIRDDVEGLMKRLTIYQKEFRVQTTKAAKNEYYLKVRPNPPDISKQALERAAWFIFLNKTGYNGLYRVNSKSEFNVPYGDYPNVSLFERENLVSISRLLNQEGIVLKWKDYGTVLLEEVEEGDFCYLDPPYYSKDNKGFTAYNASLFTAEDQRKLADVFKILTERKVKAVLSNSESDFVRELFREKEKESKTAKYTYDQLDALRVINCKSSARTGVKELLIKNY